MIVLKEVYVVADANGSVVTGQNTSTPKLFASHKQAMNSCAYHKKYYEMELTPKRAFIVTEDDNANTSNT